MNLNIWGDFYICISVPLIKPISLIGTLVTEMIKIDLVYFTTRVRHEQHERDTSATRMTRVQHK